MDLASPFAIDRAARDRPEAVDLGLLPSRHAARDAIRAALGGARGPVALTGEPGVGKTALWRSIEAARGAGEPWAAVEASPLGGPRELYRLVAREIGAEPAGFGRPELLDILAARSLDGERWTLVLDEAQNLDADSLEEVRVLSNRLGAADGFAAILLVGQTPLARRLLHRSGFALASRLAAHVHLRPLDADEVGALLAAVAPGVDWPEEAVDRIRIATGGRPGLVVDRAARSPAPARPRVSAEPPAPVVPAREAPLMGAAKPPIRVEDGLIEVGWSPEADVEAVASEPAADEGDAGEAAPESGAPSPRPEERIEDHYAALQAWHEWATNQGRHPEIQAPPEPAAPSPSPRREERTLLASSPNVWADEEHGFSPFGQLFTRLPQEKDAD